MSLPVEYASILHGNVYRQFSISQPMSRLTSVPWRESELCRDIVNSNRFLHILLVSLRVVRAVTVVSVVKLGTKNATALLCVDWFPS
jgi:hypothetical protein